MHICWKALIVTAERVGALSFVPYQLARVVYVPSNSFLWPLGALSLVLYPWCSILGALSLVPYQQARVDYDPPQK